jgi:NTE family protein
MIDKLYATNNYKIINYEIIQKDNKNVLKLIVNEDNNRLFLKFGLHYDDIFKSGLLANITVKRLFLKILVFLLTEFLEINLDIM